MTAPAPGSPGRVLVVEDDPDIRALLETRLQILGWRTRGVATGEAALAAMDQEWPSLLVLDILLPGMDGWEILRRLGTQPARELPVLVISILDRPNKEGLTVDGYLVKPFRSGDIDRAVTNLLGSSTDGR